MVLMTTQEFESYQDTADQVEDFHAESEILVKGRGKFDPEKIIDKISHGLDTLRGEGYLLAAAGLFIVWVGYAKTRGKIEGGVEGLLDRFRYH